MSFKLCFVIMSCALVAPALGYSAGAPTDACVDMKPQHGTDPQTSKAPYNLSLSRKSIRSGDEVTLTISGKSSADKIRGFLIQARQGDKPVGTFKVANDDSYLQTINCSGGKSNAVTHVKHEEDEDKRTIAVTWTSPSDLKGEIQFRATIALNGGVFWVAVPSETVKIH